jgi:ADP-heptose:LPS heptosyltransferase
LIERAVSPTILFVPVSGAYGTGEYARSLAVAQAAQQRWPQADIQFVLSREAPYAASVPFAAMLLDSSPTLHTAAVIQLIERLRPQVVVFDNAGRTAQLRAAKRSGARVVYISARARQRRKAFRWRWMSIIDEHWIAYPAFIAGALNVVERFKLARLRRPVVRYLDVMLARGTAAERAAILSRVGFDPGTYVLVVPGGGTGHPRARDAAQQFLAAALALAQGGVPVVYVGPTDAPSDQLANPSALRSFDSLPQAQLAELMRGARLVVANGGSTLLQAIASGAACVAVAIAQDQGLRIRRCAAAGVAIAASLDAASIENSVNGLLRDEASRAALAKRAAELALADGVEIALSALARLIDAD